MQFIWGHGGETCRRRAAVRTCPVPRSTGLWVNGSWVTCGGSAEALTRGWRLATDNRKAIRLAGEAGVSVLTTAEVMRRWVETLDPSAAEVATALVAIRERARFLPSGRDVRWYAFSGLLDTGATGE